MSVRTLNRFVDELESMLEHKTVAIAAAVCLALFLIAEFK